MLKKAFVNPTSHLLVQLFRYSIVVAIAFPIDFGLLYIFTDILHIHYLISTITAFTISMLVNFLISVLWVFKTRADRPLWKEILAFFIIGFVGLALTALIVWFCTSTLHLHYLVSKLVAVTIVFFWSFSARRLMFDKHVHEYIHILKNLNREKTNIMFKKSNRLQWGLVIKSPVFVTYIVGVLLLTIGLVYTYKVRPFTSDDVFWQTILLRWNPFDGTSVTLGNSSVYVDKIPFYEMVEWFFESGRKALFVQSYIPAVFGFTGFYFSCVYFLKKAGTVLSYLNLLPFIWLSSIGYTFMQLYLNPNWRGFQLGFSFLLLALTAALWNKDIKLRSQVSWALLTILTVYTGLQLYSDPYILYFTIAPLALFAIIAYIAKKIDLRKLAITLGAILLSYVVSKAFGLIASAAGIRSAVEYPMQFIQFGKLSDSIWSSIHNTLIVQNADFFGLKISTLALVPLLNCAILFIALAAVCYLFYRCKKDYKRLDISKLWFLFFVAITVMVFTLHTLTTMGDGTGTYRYFMFSVLIFTLLLSHYLGTMKNYIKYTAVLLLAASIALNLTSTLLQSQSSVRSEVQQNIANSENFRTIETLKERGYTKGYANYWDANISSYLSKGEIRFLPSVCSEGDLNAWHWLTDDASFAVKADKTFYVYNSDNTLGPCTKDILDSQLGSPSEVLRSGRWSIFLYDYDISTRIKDFTVKY